MNNIQKIGLFICFGTLPLFFLGEPGVIGWILCALVGMLVFGVGRMLESGTGRRPTRIATDGLQRGPSGGAFPVLPLPKSPGRFKVSGVDRESQQDRSEYIDADTEANARVKAEMRGMVVTRVELESPAN